VFEVRDTFRGGRLQAMDIANQSLNLVCLNQNDLKRKEVFGKPSNGKLFFGKSFNGNSP